jgi:hypothetical protein
MILPLIKIQPYLIKVCPFASKWNCPWTEVLPYKWALGVSENCCDILCSCFLRVQHPLAVLAWEIFDDRSEPFASNLVSKETKVSKRLGSY